MTDISRKVFEIMQAPYLTWNQPPGFPPQNALMLAQARAVVAYAYYRRYMCSMEERISWSANRATSDPDLLAVEALKDLFAAARYAELAAREDMHFPVVGLVAHAVNTVVQRFNCRWFDDFRHLHELVYDGRLTSAVVHLHEPTAPTFKDVWGGIEYGPPDVVAKHGSNQVLAKALKHRLQ